jgi:hypothetical protein
MHLVPQTLPISDLRFKQTETLEGLHEGPVLLTKQGKAAAMLVSTEQWNQLIELVEDLQLALDAIEVRNDVEPTVKLNDYLKIRGEHVRDRVKQ